MNLHKLIFSDLRKDRFLRHGLFCGALIFYSLLRMGIMLPPDKLMQSFSGFLLFVLYFTCIILAFSYTTVYFLVPVFFQKGKYFLFGFGLLLLFLFLQTINFVQNYYGWNPAYSQMTGIPKGKPDLGTAVIRLLGNPVLVCGLLLSLKSIKTWHLKQQEKETLLRENSSAELQLLKAQVHPHFLFNTLNNIYSYSLNKSSKAAELVQKLSNMLRYMVTECDQPLVPLKDELKMIQDYLGLEKIRYGSRLSMQVEIKYNDKQGYITPLLMIPFVENSFKHGASQTLEHPWIMLKIYTEENILYFSLSNSKPTPVALQHVKGGIGLKNVQKRLALLYPNQHFLKIESLENQFSVNMRIPLLEKREVIPDDPVHHSISYTQLPLYA